MEIVNLSGEIPNLGNTMKVLVASDNAGYKKGWETTKFNFIFAERIFYSFWMLEISSLCYLYIVQGANSKRIFNEPPHPMQRHIYYMYLWQHMGREMKKTMVRSLSVTASNLRIFQIFRISRKIIFSVCTLIDFVVCVRQI